MLDKAARRGAKEALRSIGLLDDDAQKDIIEMKNDSFPYLLIVRFYLCCLYIIKSSYYSRDAKGKI